MSDGDGSRNPDENVGDWKPSARAFLKGGPNRRQQNRARTPSRSSRKIFLGPKSCSHSLTQSVSQTSRRRTGDRPQEKLLSERQEEGRTEEPEICEWCGTLTGSPSCDTASLWIKQCRQLCCQCRLSQLCPESAPENPVRRDRHDSSSSRQVGACAGRGGRCGRGMECGGGGGVRPRNT